MATNGDLVVSNPTCMESVNRVSKLPLVESTIQTATNIYGKVKDYNSVTNWTLSTAESTVNKAVEVGKPIVTPVIQKFEDPIKKVDNILCSSLDYVETKVPAVKMPPNEIYNTTKEYLSPAIESAKSYAAPAYNTAKEIACDKAHAIKGNVMDKVDELLHKVHERTVGDSCGREGLEEEKVEDDRRE